MESILFCLYDPNAYLWLTRALRKHLLMSEEGARKSDESDRMAEKEQLRLRKAHAHSKFQNVRALSTLHVTINSGRRVKTC